MHKNIINKFMHQAPIIIHFHLPLEYFNKNKPFNKVLKIRTIIDKNTYQRLKNGRECEKFAAMIFQNEFISA